MHESIVLEPLKTTKFTSLIAEETTYCGKCHEGDRGSIMLRGELLVYLILCDCCKFISNNLNNHHVSI